VLVVLPQVVYSYAFGILFFHEHLTLFGVAGTALIALGMACVTARTAPQQQQQGEKLSDAARDAAGAGLGSRMFSRILQEDSLGPQQEGGLRSLQRSSSSSSFLARMQSFQRLLAGSRNGDASGDLGGYQYHAAGSGEAEGTGLLPTTQQQSSSLTTTAAAGSGSQRMTSSLLAAEEQLSEQQNWGHSSSGPMQHELNASVARDVELAAIGALQQRHVQQHQKQLQQQRWNAASSDAQAVAAGRLTGGEEVVMPQLVTGWRSAAGQTAGPTAAAGSAATETGSGAASAGGCEAGVLYTAPFK
jgi:hypothetical protein